MGIHFNNCSSHNGNNVNTHSAKHPTDTGSEETMGYRSDVAIGLSNEADVQLRLSDKKLAIQVLDDADDTNKYENHTNYFLGDVKWYQGYQDVDQVMEFLDSLQHDEFGYMRIGENDDDIEIKGDPYEYGIELNRHLSI